MLHFYPAELFAEISLPDKLQLRYAITNYGRLISFTNTVEEGRFVKGSLQDGYRVWRYKTRDSTNTIRNKNIFLCKLVAKYFLTKTSDDQVYVLHLDRNRANDFFKNLQWATKVEMIEHSKRSPYVIAAKKKQLQLLRDRRDGNKLNSTKVMFLKKKLLDPNRKTRIKTLAKRFGVTPMTLYRIKSGENWGHIKV